jgi:hypothetical protein
MSKYEECMKECKKNNISIVNDNCYDLCKKYKSAKEKYQTKYYKENPNEVYRDSRGKYKSSYGKVYRT